MLLQLVTAQDDKPFGVIAFQHGFRKLFPERSRAAGDENRFVVKVHHQLKSFR
jgi:hypothetical protein